MKKYYLGLLILISVGTLKANQNCTDIDLRNNVLGNVRDQGEIAWCYAYTASDLITHKLNVAPFSAADTAITYNVEELPRLQKYFTNLYSKILNKEDIFHEHETGFMFIALRAAMKRGLCLEKDFPSEEVIRVDAQGEKWVKFAEAAIEINKLRMSIKSALRRKKPIEENVWFKFPQMTKQDFYHILKTKNRHQVFYELSKNICQGQRKVIPNFELGYHVRNKNIFSKIDQQLEKKNLVGISYFMSILKNHDGKLKEFHSSALVGRRFNTRTNQCEYLIRNSHGPDCTGYDSRLDCEEGNIWMPKKSLQRAILDAIYLK